VNGGQTSHVLFQERDALDDRGFIPIKVISTEDDALTTAVITATNSQTAVKADELNSRAEFERKLEQFFNTFEGPKALHYERRSKQYNENTEIEKVRIITRQQLVRSFAAMFRGEPHRATGYVPGLMAQLGDQIFQEEHVPELYYASAFAHYKLEFFWRNGPLDPECKPGRWQILMAARHLAIGDDIGFFNLRQAARKANDLCEVLWVDRDALALFNRAFTVVGEATDETWERDQMRNDPTTQDVLRVLRSA
jgi:AIPR protein